MSIVEDAFFNRKNFKIEEANRQKHKPEIYHDASFQQFLYSIWRIRHNNPFVLTQYQENAHTSVERGHRAIFRKGEIA